MSIHKKLKLKYYITQKRQEQNLEEQESKRKFYFIEMQCELEREIYHLQKMLCKLQDKKYLLLLQFKQVLDEEVEVERQRYIERTSIRLEYSMMENECAEINITTH